jgi:hypothetical protein
VGRPGSAIGAGGDMRELELEDMRRALDGAAQGPGFPFELVGAYLEHVPWLIHQVEQLRRREGRVLALERLARHVKVTPILFGKEGQALHDEATEALGEE